VPSLPVATLPHPLDVDVGDGPVSRSEGTATSQFESLYERRFADTCRFVRALGGTPQDVEDLTQETFLVARRKLDGFDGRNEAAWLFAIARNVVRDQRRKRWFRSFFSRTTEASVDTIVSRDGDPETQLERAQSRRIAERAIETMTEKRRVPFVLFEIEGYSGEEIGKLLDVPVATVWTRLHHARKDFAAFVAEEAER